MRRDLRVRMVAVTGLEATSGRWGQRVVGGGPVTPGWVSTSHGRRNAQVGAVPRIEPVGWPWIGGVDGQGPGGGCSKAAPCNRSDQPLAHGLTLWGGAPKGWIGSLVGSNAYMKRGMAPFVFFRTSPPTT